MFKVEDILRMGESCSLPALVFSNACHSAEENTGLIDPGYQRASYGMASAFLFAGVRHYIGSIRKIEDSPSLVFAREFYAQLISGVSVGESMRLAKLKLVNEFGIFNLHWVNYLLYGDPGFVFFKFHRHREHKRKFPAVHKRAVIKTGLAVFFICSAILLTVCLPKFNPAAIYLFLNSQAEYRKGNNLSAIGLGERLISKDQNFLAAYPIIANAYHRLGNKDRAVKYYYDYVLKSGKLNNNKHLIQAYVKLGWFYQMDGQFAKARELYDKAMDLSRRLGDKSNEALVLRKMAVWHIDQNNLDQALDLLTKSVSINLERCRNFENARNLACDYFDIGLVFVNKNDYSAAKNFYEKSRKIFERLNLKNELSDCYFNLGEIYLFEKEYSKALDYYSRGLKIDQKQNNKVNLASGYNMVGELYMEIDDLAKAEEFFKDSAKLAEEIDSRLDFAGVNYNLGLLYRRQGKKSMAREHWRKAQEIYRLVDLDKYQETRVQLLELDNI